MSALEYFAIIAAVFLWIRNWICNFNTREVYVVLQRDQLIGLHALCKKEERRKKIVRPKGTAELLSDHINITDRVEVLFTSFEYQAAAKFFKQYVQHYVDEMQYTDYYKRWKLCAIYLHKFQVGQRIEEGLLSETLVAMCYGETVDDIKWCADHWDGIQTKK
jgi:hypothetical protein